MLYLVSQNAIAGPSRIPINPRPLSQILEEPISLPGKQSTNLEHTC